MALAASVNLGGDLLLVNGFGRGIAGAAWATAVSQVRLPLSTIDCA